jgi:hypothetical protein
MHPPGWVVWTKTRYSLVVAFTLSTLTPFPVEGLSPSAAMTTMDLVKSTIGNGPGADPFG